MAKKARIDEQFLRRAGFKEGSDGVWSKEDRSPEDSPSGPDPEPSEEQPLEEAAQMQATPIRRTIAIVTIRTVRSRDYDGLGAATKYYLDALRHCGLFQDDSPEYLEVVCCAERCAHFSEEETLIELYEEPQSHPPLQL